MAFEFTSGNLALDYVGTLSERTTTRFEHLRGGADLRDWIRAAHLTAGPTAVGRDDLDRAIALREALYAVLAALVDGRPLPGPDLAAVNAAASQPTPVPRIDRAGRIRWRAGVPAVLSAIARSGVELFDLPDRGLLRRCADGTCTRLFVDRSRGARRRWCGMAGCGDRAKAAAYRDRQRGQGGRAANR